MSNNKHNKQPVIKFGPKVYKRKNMRCALVDPGPITRRAPLA